MARPSIIAPKVEELLTARPMLTDREIASYVGCVPNYVSKIRAKLIHGDAEVCARVDKAYDEVPKHQRHLIQEHLWNGVGERVWCRHGIDFLGEPCEICSAEVRRSPCEHGYSANEYCHPCATKAVVEVINAPDDEAVTPQELDTLLDNVSVLSKPTLDNILDERGSRYGSFVKHAFITQRLKAIMTDTDKWMVLDDDMIEALEMIAHKIGRILNGDPSYPDSWVDIAGYAQLVADRLEGKVR